MMTIKTYTRFVILGLILLTACHRTPYYMLDTPSQVSLRIEFDWGEYKNIPPGMNLVFYQIADEEAAAVQTIPTQLQYGGGEVSLPAGRYSVLVYSDYTYDIEYRGMGDFHTAEAYLKESARLPLATRLPATRNLVSPDVFYLAQIEELLVSHADEGRTLVLEPELKTLTVHVHVRGTGGEHVKGIEGGLSGFASSLMLSTGQSRDAESSSVLFPLEKRNGEICATAGAFLMADNMERDYILQLAFLFNNNSVSISDKYSYDVTDQIVEPLKANEGRIPPDGIHVYIENIEIGPVSDSGGLDAVINEWGDNVYIEL